MASLSNIAQRMDKLEKALVSKGPVLTVRILSFVGVGPIKGWTDRAGNYYERKPEETDDELSDRASKAAQDAELLEGSMGERYAGIIVLHSVNSDSPEEYPKRSDVS